MNFSNPAVIEQVAWELKLADYARSLNRSKVNDLFNGVPPYSDEQVRENNIAVNVNFLEATKLAHDARRQFYNAFLKPGNFFVVTLDSGPIHKRRPWGKIITAELNRCLKRSQVYYETMRSTFANVVLHGIGPCAWMDRDTALPKAIGIDDVLFPSSTLVSMENVEFFALQRRYTAAQLHRLTTGPKVDPGWKMPVVKQCIEWAHRQGTQNIAYQDIYSPERISELLKSDLGFYASDKVPTIDCWDFYFREDSHGEEGWCRRIVLNAMGDPGIGGVEMSSSSKTPERNILGERGQFLYDSGKRKVAAKLSQLLHFQFGDLSAVAPFRYHSVRSLGFLVFAVCHLQNRLRCRFNEALFEHLLQYFRVNNPDDSERALKIELINRGIIDNSVEFIKAQDRWQISQGLIESGLAHNRELMGTNAAAYTQDYDFGKERTAKTATEVMAQVNASTALVSAALQQAYASQNFQYLEICARFCRKNSRDAMVRKARAAMLRQGVPEEFLCSDRWDIEPERVLGSGNKMLEMSIAQQLMAVRNLYDPESQREVLKDYTLAITDDPARTERLVPEAASRVTDSVHDAQLAMGTLMQGLPVSIKSGINRIEYIEAMLVSLGTSIMAVEQSGGMATAAQIQGFGNVLNHLQQNISLLAQDENEKQRVKVYMDDLGKLANLVKAYGQRLQEQVQQQQATAQPDPQKILDLQVERERANIKLENQRLSHSARTAERQVAFENEELRKQQAHQAELARKAEEAVIQGAKEQISLDSQQKKAEIAKATSAGQP